MKRTAILVCALALAVLAQPAITKAQEADAAITGISKAFNPAISVNGLFYHMSTSAPDEDHEAEEGEQHGHEHAGFETGFHLQEAEIRLTANVDAYFKADMTIAFEGDETELENLYIETLSMPAGLRGTIGKVYVPFGLHNQLHTHMYPFLEQPLINEAVFGDHGWVDTGASMSWLAPLPWYFEVIVGGYDGSGEMLFESDRKGDYAGAGRVENLWPIGDAATFRLGGSYAYGPTTYEVFEGDTLMAEMNPRTQVWGGDVQIKIRPPETMRTFGVVLQGEYIQERQFIDNEDWTDPREGYYAMGMVQVSKWWWLQARYDWMTDPPELAMADEFTIPADAEDMTSQRWSYAVALVPTHFQAYKFQYSVIDRGGEMEYRTYAQVNFTIGSHPAHEY